ncbi:MAG: UDP-glucose 4-epimerase GalE [Deltaproteobacteria bacterium]|nr:UDP-glucose 4-epimerase GalE [Deltaproteobacteria bacterium]
MNVLVTGAAGYIGSHAVQALLRAGHAVVALDNLSRGHRQAVPSAVPFVQADVRDSERVLDVLRSHRIECVMHFAAFAYVGESVEQPLLYYDNNTLGTLGLLRAVARSDCRRFVFSSTCSTYGVPDTLPIHESAAQSPINPYGASKLCSERMLRDLRPALPDFACAILRYFNVAGCASDGSLGEHHEPETHLIPVLLQAALGQRDKVTVFGTDYPTPDGTCIRDYLHVEDLVDAHIGVMQALAPGAEMIYNLGMGRGHSVREVIAAARTATGRPFHVEFGARRPGDPPTLYSDPSKIRRELGWKARRTDLAQIIETAWRWFRDNPRRYG